MTPKALSDWCLRCLSFEDRTDHAYSAAEQMANEVAVQMPSPDEVDQMPVSERAKALRRTLLDTIHSAETVEVARQAMLDFAEALLDIA